MGDAGLPRASHTIAVELAPHVTDNPNWYVKIPALIFLVVTGPFIDMATPELEKLDATLSGSTGNDMTRRKATDDTHAVPRALSF